jgi:TetR/AcrR family transcriptional repressor of nem operon
VARTREFDEDVVLDAALQAFWRKGYEATSLSDLLEATGLARQSLYNAFGDKRTLFLAALRRYVERSVSQLEKGLERGPVKAAIRRVFETMPAANRDCGCFLVNSAAELMPRDPEVGILFSSALARQERALAEALRRGVRTGELRLSPKRIGETARFLVSALHGIRVIAKATPKSPALRDTVAVALRAID